MQTLPNNLRIGVIRGGPSAEYDVSLKSGANVLKTLSETHRPLDIFISKDGTWHVQGIVRSPERILPHVDVVFNALHGAFGEDGKLQKILDHHGVKYTGSNSYSSAICMNKVLSKEIFIKHGLKTPHYAVIKRNDDIAEKVREIFKTFVMPVIVKPAGSGSSIGVSVVRTIPEIIDAARSAFKHGTSVLVEEFIKGKEATCAVMEDWRGQPVYALLPVEIRMKNEDKFFDYDSKYSDGACEEICPGKFLKDEKNVLEECARKAHESLQLSHYSRSDFIVSPNRGVYILETNSLPGLTDESLLPKSLSAVGISTRDFLHHVLSLAMSG